MLEVKICGLATRDAVDVAVEAGARYVGFVFFPPSPRSLDTALAASLATPVPPSVVRVGLFVDADDDYLGDVLSRVPLDMAQFHGAEPPERIERGQTPMGQAGDEGDIGRTVRGSGARSGAMTAWPIGCCSMPGLRRAPIVPAATPGASIGPCSRAWIRRLPWMLAGGIDIENVAAAVRLSGARAVDVSSGVEDAPGVKNPEKIRAFLDVAATI